MFIVSVMIQCIPKHDFTYTHLNTIKWQVTGNEDDTTKANEVIDTDSNDIDAKITEETEGEKLNPAASISSLVIEEVTITVPQMETSDVDGGNVSEKRIFIYVCIYLLIKY